MKNKPSKQPKKQNKGVKKNKKQYKVRNWREYNQALVNRGNVELWVSEEALQKWVEDFKSGKKRNRGKPRLYSNSAIETALTIQQVFHLTLRQTEGFLTSILKRIGSNRASPDYSTLSIRGKTLPVHLRTRAVNGEPLHIVIDSTGAKVYGEGEWKVRKHGWSKHRTWKKLHIGADETTGDILLGEVTDNDTADCEVLESLLEQIPEETPVGQVSADGAYDKRMCYAALKKKGIEHVAIPPQHNAKIWRHGNTKAESFIRDENLRRIRKLGRKHWKQEIHYHRRSLAETAMFRLKTIFTDKVQARIHANQRVQLLLRCKALNRMTMLGMPDSYIVA